ncbi:energy transducer TonB [uncultured Bacteroides sp.]|uniref:energy transducer TonB n=1 Tax=uncultured Bacteroides sp. TaxID=162156 RepID=UPI002AA69989|nr:energy transducer TonB [uncultured Bacteroides sp.]
MRNIFIMFGIFVCFSLFADNVQQNHKSSDSINRKIYQVMETDSMPVFKGGYDSLLVYVKDHFVFPEIYAETSIQGRVICRFVITEDGAIVDVKVIQSLDSLMDEEIVRVIRSMPKWIPGKRKGKAVKVEYYLPIVCRLK